MSLSVQRLLILLLLLMPPALAQESGEPAADSASIDVPASQQEVPGQDDTQETSDQQSAEQAAAQAMADEARERVQQLLRESASGLESELAARSNELGHYDVALAELQSDLGRIYLELGEYALATEVLQQALQLVRINRGLYDPAQIQVLEQLVSSLRAQSDWDRVDDYQHLVFSLQSRVYQPDSPEFADAALAMGEWQVVATRARLTGRSGSFQSIERLSNLKDVYSSVLVHAEERGDVARQWEIRYSAALVDIEIARHYLSTDMNDMMIAASRYVTQTVCRTVSDGAGGYQRVCWQESVSNPDYYRQVNNQRRTQLERARMSLQSARRDMQALMDNNPEFVSQNAERTEAGMQNLTTVLEDLQRESRRATLGGAW
ncbi:MAG: tetratricopeptide repeat protein [Pseudohongiella sp.]|nr:tetratricopeptide repeat protein [Pseudohongiella sp.]